MTELYSSSIQFIPLREVDLKRINELSNNPDISVHFETIPPVSMESTYAFWHFVQNGLVSLWGIHYNEQIIGGAGFYANPQGTRLSHVATFFLYLDPDFWGKGIGVSAMKFLETEIQNRGYLRMECMVAECNPRAIRLYQKMGFLHEGVKKQCYLIDNTYVDLIIMGKVLAEIQNNSP